MRWDKMRWDGLGCIQDLPAHNDAAQSAAVCPFPQTVKSDLQGGR